MWDANGNGCKLAVDILLAHAKHNLPTFQYAQKCNVQTRTCMSTSSITLHAQTQHSFLIYSPVVIRTIRGGSTVESPPDKKKMPQEIKQHCSKAEIKHRRQQRKLFFVRWSYQRRATSETYGKSLPVFSIFTFYGVLLTKPTDLESGPISCCP